MTHGDFIRFIDDGGYRRPELWLAEGWEAVQARGWQAPLYWRHRDGAWHTFTLHGESSVDPNTPVCHVSFYEADAYARWANARLPSEAEWEIAAGRTPVEGNFVESGALHPLAPREQSAEGALAQAFGDVWEWTRSDYGPYPGFSPRPARSANTTASSCAASTSCAAARAPRRRATSAPPTGTSSRPTRAGSSAAFASPGTRSARLGGIAGAGLR